MRRSNPDSDITPANSYDPRPGDARVTAVTALFLIALLILMTVL